MFISPFPKLQHIDFKTSLPGNICHASCYVCLIMYCSMYRTFTLCHSYVFLYHVMPAYLFYLLVVPVHVILVLSSLVFCFSVYICHVLCMQKSLSVFKIKVLRTHQLNTSLHGIHTWQSCMSMGTLVLWQELI